MNDKCGVAILTYNRPEYFKEVLASIPRNMVDELVIVNDGTPYNDINLEKDIELIQHPNNQGVAISKNDAIHSLMNKGCAHLFLIEDDIVIKNPEVFNEYVRHAKVSGIYHLNFEQVTNNPRRLVFSYGDNIDIALYRNPWASFSYIFANIISKLGAFDINYKNAFEHIEFAYRLIRNGLMPPFWYFPDILNSNDYLEAIKGSIENSTITDQPDYQKNYNISAQHFIQAHGHFTSQIADVPSNKALARLQQIQKIYGKKEPQESTALQIIKPNEYNR